MIDSINETLTRFRRGGAGDSYIILVSPRDLGVVKSSEVPSGFVITYLAEKQVPMGRFYIWPSEMTKQKS